LDLGVWEEEDRDGHEARHLGVRYEDTYQLDRPLLLCLDHSLRDLAVMPTDELREYGYLLSQDATDSGKVVTMCMLVAAADFHNGSARAEGHVA
jgi:hypothetical protein